MKVIDAGHVYELNSLDTDQNNIVINILTFVKRDKPPEKYPGNIGSHAGTTIQEVCRALIERCIYVNKQDRCGETEACITYLRKVIIELEVRAARRHGRGKLQLSHDIENMPVCRICGHIQCEETCRKKEESDDVQGAQSQNA